MNLEKTEKILKTKISPARRKRFQRQKMNLEKDGKFLGQKDKSGKDGKDSERQK